MGNGLHHRSASRTEEKIVKNFQAATTRMEKAFRGLAAAVFRDNAWSKLVKPNMPPGRIDLPSAPHSSRFRAPELRFAERTTEGQETYNHFQITADISTFKEWREQIKLRKDLRGKRPPYFTFKVPVGSTNAEALVALEAAGRKFFRQDGEKGGDLPVITTFKVRVGGTREDVEAALEAAGREVTRQEESGLSET